MSNDVTTKFKKIKESYVVSEYFDGISKEDVEHVLGKLGLDKTDLIDCIWVLLDDKLNNVYSESFKICNGASTAHIGAYIAILLGNSEIKSDREYMRDYVIKPLLEIGAVERMTFLTKKNKKVNVSKDGFYNGHLIPKSSGLCYTLSQSFKHLLKSCNKRDFDSELKKWISEESKKERLDIVKDMEEKNKLSIVKDDHGKLIEMSIEIYAKNYLEGYKVVYTDALDGDRITEDERILLDKYYIKFGDLESVWPDVILYNEDKDSLWFIEAVTSDGEVDSFKLEGLKKICQDSKKKFAGATTTYLNYVTFGKRQEKNNNIVKDTYVWIVSSPDKLIKIK